MFTPREASATLRTIVEQAIGTTAPWQWRPTAEGTVVVTYIPLGDVITTFRITRSELAQRAATLAAPTLREPVRSPAAPIALAPELPAAAENSYSYACRLCGQQAFTWGLLMLDGRCLPCFARHEQQRRDAEAALIADIVRRHTDAFIAQGCFDALPDAEGWS